LRFQGACAQKNGVRWIGAPPQGDAQNWCICPAPSRKNADNDMILKEKIYWHKGC
jgi:hypothetical protein